MEENLPAKPLRNRARIASHGHMCCDTTPLYAVSSIWVLLLFGGHVSTNKDLSLTSSDRFIGEVERIQV
ncbi:hypothetical protein pdam_00005710 [Pocillopora damicornis]|uniref:Uncharacterized protein n=1 Tax=Pocillopora damicornis TaxID=46731 RepID=A0A3M6V147_POCDA|nr:hypothetical protein pdam_00005710 [Pocillopora damicornis]